MDSPGEILRLCRLCLVKDCVNIPIFEEEGDARQIFLKISSCLPVKVSREDRLPKKICDGCSEKLNSFYEFWSSSADAEKTLLSWVGQEEEEAEKKTEPSVPKPLAALVKEESEVADESHAQLVEEEEESTKDEEVEAPPAKRARRSAAVRAQKNITLESEDDDLDTGEPLTKMEEESADSDGEDKDPSYVEVPGTSADDEQAGPSGVGKDAVEAPLHNFYSLNIRFINRLRGLDQKFSCGVCKKQFFRKDGLKAHELMHMDKSLRKYHPCDKCSKLFLNQRSLDCHIKRVHLKQFKYACLKCPGKTFVQSSELNQHVKTHHLQIEPDLIKCTHPGCSKVFTSKSSLKYHQSSHEAQTFVCDQCGRLFTHPHLYKRHLRKHRQQPKMHRCHVCDKTVTSLSSLKDHMRLHSGERPYICEHCGKGFRTRVILKSHLVVHTKVKSHVCQFCGRGFTQRSPLKTHLVNFHKKLMQGDT